MQDFPIFEPLSKATRRELSPLDRLKKDDYLEIWMEDEKFAIRPIIIRDGEILSSGWPSWQANNFCHRIPEMKKERNYFLVGATDFTAIMINTCWPKDKLHFRGDESRIMYRYLLQRFLMQTSRANIQAQFKLNGIVPKMPDDYDEHPEYPQSDYQKTAMAMAINQEATALFMDRGTGKTCVGINRICLEAKRMDRMMRIIIVCPKKARYNWQKEFEKFTTVPGKVTILKGGKVRRIRLLTHAVRTEEDCEYTAIIIPYDTLASDIEILQKIPFDLAISDESHYFKGRNTNRWTAMQMLRGISKQRMIFTGTPIANNIFDLWTQLEFLGKGLSGFTSFEQYRKFHGKFEEPVQGASGSGVSRLIGIEHIPLVKERLSRLTFSITKEEAGLGLPDKVCDYYEVDMSPKQQDFYTQLVDELAIEIATDMVDSDVLTANHILTKLLRLEQICSGFVKWDAVFDFTGELKREARIEQIDEQNPKLEAIIDMLKEDFGDDPNAKTIIWATFVEDIRAICERLEQEDIKYVSYYGKNNEKTNQESEFAFNNDNEVRVFIGNPKSAGDSINLLGYNPEKGGRCYANHEIYFSMNWSMIEREQSEDRAHRRGTKMPVRITDLVVPSSIDTEIRDRVQNKVIAAESLQDIQGILHRVLNLEV